MDIPYGTNSTFCNIFSIFMVLIVIISLYNNNYTIYKEVNRETARFLRAVFRTIWINYSRR